MVRELASIQLVVADLETAEAFYGGVLELPVRRAMTAPGAPEHFTLQSAGCELIFVEESAVIRTHPILTEKFENFPKGVGMTLHFQVDGIEDIYDAVIEEDLEILYPLEEKPYGMKELWCFDPDGYLVVLEEPSR